MNRRRQGEGSRYGDLAGVHTLMEALEATPGLAYRLRQEKPRTAEHARALAEMRWRQEEHAFQAAHHADAEAEARRRFDAAGGTEEAWLELAGIERAAFHVVTAVYGPAASTLAVDGFDPGIPSWLVRTGELAGAACAAGPDTWREFLKLTRHPLSR